MKFYDSDEKELIKTKQINMDKSPKRKVEWY